VKSNLQVDPSVQPIPTHIRLEVSRFDGNDPLGWIFKVNQFFDYHRIADEQRLHIASFYMEGEALSWYQWMHSNGQLLSWLVFLRALELRFAPSELEDPQGALFKLTQTSSVREYQAQFENLANRVNGLSAPFYLSCFISGLKLEICQEVIPFRPNSLSEAISLAKLQEKITANTLKLGFNTAKSNPRYRASPTANHNTDGLLPTPTHVKPFSASPSSSNSSSPRVVTHVRKLTTTDLQARRENGLCYYCDEKYARGHRCKKQFNLLIAAPKIPSMDDELNHLLEQLDLQVDPSPDPHSTPESLNAHIGIHTLMGQLLPF